MEKKEPIPIGQGELIKDDRLHERIKEIRKDVTELYDRVLNIGIEKERLRDEELQKPAGEINADLMALLEGDLETLRDIETQLLEIIEGSYDTEEKVLSHFDAIAKRIEEKGF